LANHLNEYLKPHESITGDHIRLSSAATALHDVLAWGLADAGDGMLLSRPVYGRFKIDLGDKSQIKAVFADTDPKTCLEANEVDKYEEALVRAEAEGTRIRAVLIVNPHNPLGQFDIGPSYLCASP
jgi:1-aminocyclopropane-1-carboxylate synthase